MLSSTYPAAVLSDAGVMRFRMDQCLGQSIKYSIYAPEIVELSRKQSEFDPKVI